MIPRTTETTMMSKTTITPAYQPGGITQTVVRVSDLPDRLLYNDDGTPREDMPRCITCGEPVVGDTLHSECRTLHDSLLIDASVELVRKVGPLAVWRTVPASWSGAGTPARLERVIWTLDRNSRLQTYRDAVIAQDEAYGLTQVGDRVPLAGRPAGDPPKAQRDWLRAQ